MCELLLDAANKPCGESSTINVSSGNTLIVEIAFQYISGCGLLLFTSSFEIIKSKYSIIFNFDKTVNTVFLIEFEQQAILKPFLFNFENISCNIRDSGNVRKLSSVNFCFSDQIKSCLLVGNPRSLVNISNFCLVFKPSNLLKWSLQDILYFTSTKSNAEFNVS